ncbi:MAG: UDP-N-acetylmuramate dehydrogenase [Candidatus Tantalella remota]|nr:UDP-N-acetylmuramate dehydrogenase [Candidatus Tantalella remota]
MITDSDRNAIEEYCREVGDIIFFGEPLAPRSAIEVGGRGVVWIEPRNEETLAGLIRLLTERGVRSMVVGGGSNILFPDADLETVLIKLNSQYFMEEDLGDTMVMARAGVSLPDLISTTCSNGLAGLEGLVGIPATVGGAVFMNASYRTEVSNMLVRVRVMDPDGEARWVGKREIDFAWHWSSLSDEKDVITEAVFEFEEEDPRELESRLKNYFVEKMEKQPLDGKSLGCIFRNPEGAGKTAGQLIDAAGMKGCSHGGARVSEKHANFIINTGGAKASDVMSLMYDIRKEVKEKFSVDLESEIRIL